jgi:tRNA-2-methylthio-N6-dimethylallyladenosine synthase
MNEHDSERIAGLLVEDGMTETTSQDNADVIVLNTCCIRENADNKLYASLGELKKRKEDNPDLQIAVGGCLAQKDRDLIQQKAKHVDVVFGTHNLHRAAELLRKSKIEGPILEILEEHEAYPSMLPARRETPFNAWVTIQIGCDNTCTYCIVPSVRGKEISRRMGDIIHEVEELASEGVTEITLLGQNVNSYGRDLGTGQYKPKFADLLRGANEIEGIERIRFTSPHPKDLRPETILAMSECESVCNQLHLPVQSGSDRILSKMHRGYTAERYLEKLKMAREAMPGLAISTDIIVGFPGETEEDFQATLDLVHKAKYDMAFTYVFSSRPGTVAAEMEDEFVDPKVSKERMLRLTEAISKHTLEHNEKLIGTTQEVLVEGKSKKDSTKISGRTPQFKLVHFDENDIDKSFHEPGSLVEVEIHKAAPFWLLGSGIKGIRGPKHKVSSKKLLPIL